VAADDASEHQVDQEQQDQDHDDPLQLAEVRELHVVHPTPVDIGKTLAP
jgi:hypothetical protein